ncbi:hypothetical protein CLOSTASPAR_04891 [[Clostridium] asparagiforme DSM 15981]|uniref:Uncharacterized protein n=1 Tax=[Clostridium] asparagiforme DSM 15981 TaxID=518636 RepID=C0D6J4_9FIRM|nr:hypothetical protein CLOSTASPAR_04891 [[Clostridium] asparagiforme DSM 15981]
MLLLFCFCAKTTICFVLNSPARLLIQQFIVNLYCYYNIYFYNFNTL